MPASAKAAILPKKPKTVGLPLLHPYEISKGEGATYFFATDNGLKDGRLKKFDFQTDDVYVSLIINKDYFAIDEAVNDISQLLNEVLALK